VVAVPSRGRADLQAHAPESDATRALYEQYGRQLYAFCYSRLRSREEAEDAVQSTFLNAFRALQRDVAPAHEAAWLYKIAENVCLTRARSSVRRRRVESPGDLEAISEVVPAHDPDTEELVNLPQALESMPEQQRRALLLREWQGLSYREIAEEMELTQSAVETLLFRARRTLAAGLAVEEPKRHGKLARLRAGGDAGALLALLKTLLFSGGGKVVVVGAVAASGLVGVSPNARHQIDEFFGPQVTAAAPHHTATVAKKAKPVVQRAPVVVAPVIVHHATPVRPVHVVPKKKAHKHVVAAHHVKARHLGRLGHIDQPLRPVAPVAATPPPAETTTTTVVAVAPPPPAPTPTPATSNGNAKGKAKHSTESPAPAPPAPTVPPVVPATPEGEPPPVAPQQDDNGNNGHGHDGHGHGKN
jgi:RNA polymerase sigma factor (sigma-70 family)